LFSKISNEKITVRLMGRGIRYVLYILDYIYSEVNESDNVICSAS